MAPRRLPLVESRISPSNETCEINAASSLDPSGPLRVAVGAVWTVVVGLTASRPSITSVNAQRKRRVRGPGVATTRRTGPISCCSEALRYAASCEETIGLTPLVAKMYDQAVADALRIQYGGSVKADNAFELMSQKDVDGALVGGAALKVDSFLGIIEGARKAKGLA